MKNNLRQRPVADEPIGIVISGGMRDEVLPRVWAYIWGPVPAEDEEGDLTPRELRIAGAIAYWCEGSKRKTHRPAEHVSFINSDPGLILL